MPNDRPERVFLARRNDGSWRRGWYRLRNRGLDAPGFPAEEYVHVSVLQRLKEELYKAQLEGGWVCPNPSDHGGQE